MSDPLILNPIQDEVWPDQISDMKSGFAGGLNVYRTMAHHPELLRAWAGLRDHIVNHTALGPERAEVVILRAGFRLGSSYEWSQHVIRARKCGLDDARIAALCGDAENVNPEDEVIVRAVDELILHARLGTSTRDELAALTGKAGVLDLMATVGFYSTLGFILNTFETPLDDDIVAQLIATPFQEPDK
ncbi:carboxymuconolactone decarboxylase family protein [Arenibacterium sp. CAU 1754]